MWWRALRGGREGTVYACALAICWSAAALRRINTALLSANGARPVRVCAAARTADRRKMASSLVALAGRRDDCFGAVLLVCSVS